MTTEEKARAYDEAVERAREYHNSPRTCFDIDGLKYIFPELKESEDEKIRKKLIESVKGDLVIGGTKDKAKAIAWLEKQGEKKPVCRKREDGHPSDWEFYEREHQTGIF